MACPSPSPRRAGGKRWDTTSKEHTVGVAPVTKGQAARRLRMSEAAEYIGISEQTLRRRVDAWREGRRDSAYAIMGELRYGTEGERLVDADDAERARLQQLQQLPSTVTALDYAASLRTPDPD